MNKIKFLAAVLIAVAGLSLQQVKADTFTYTLGTSNFGGFTPGPNGFVTATVTTDGTNVATVTFTSQTVTQNSTGNLYEALMGDGQTIALNVSAALSGAVITASANSGVGFTQNLAADFSYGSGNADGFGNFNLTVDTTDGFTHSMSSITISLTKFAGNWGLANTVLTGNNNNYVAAAHTFLTQIVGGTWFQSNGAFLTGYVANGNTINVPDGGTTVMLLGVALGALGVVRRYLTS